MLHTKFRGNLLTDSGEEDYPRRLHIKFQLDWPSGFREEDL